MHQRLVSSRQPHRSTIQQGRRSMEAVLDELTAIGSAYRLTAGELRYRVLRLRQLVQDALKRWPDLERDLALQRKLSQQRARARIARLRRLVKWTMIMRDIPRRLWRPYGNDPLPSPLEALNEPLRSFPSWFLRIECDRCGKVQLINQIHVPHDELPIRQILARMRHDGCGGRAAKAELLTGVEGVSNRPVRKIVLTAA